MENIVIKSPKECIYVIENILDNDPLTSSTVYDLKDVIRYLYSVKTFNYNDRYIFVKKLYSDGAITYSRYKELCNELAENAIKS